jgi:RNase H-like domain found in reverse transcriptase/Reverse transcriptase (RNA-dependent DNA polymerase)/Integrase zinc binding domain
MRGGFFIDSAVIMARLSQTRTDIVSPNRFAALESCTFKTMPSRPALTPEGLRFFNVDSMIKTADKLCQTTLENKEGCECYWHKRLESELEEYLSRETWKKPWEEEGQSIPPPEQPDAGSQCRKRDPSSESIDHRPLKRGTSRDSERTNRPTSKQNNQEKATTEGKLLKPTPEKRHNFQRRFRGKMTTPGTAMWVAQRLAEAKQEEQKGILGLWAHPKRQAEVTEDTVNAINDLSDEDAVEALRELRRTKRFIRAVGKDQMSVPVHLQTLDDGHILRVIALLDSGCTGLCIDREFVRKNNIQMKKVPLPIPVYNADGSLNEGGPITEFVEVRMVIQDHTERIHFAVSNLGKTELFIGHEWLKKHNPNIDWRTSTLTFDRCPKECDYITTLDDLEGDHDHEQVADEPKVRLNEGERLFAFDVNSYSANRVSMDNGEEQLSLNPEDPIFEERVPTHYHEYKDVFDKKDFDQLPERRIWDHVIELTPDFKPIDCKIYPLSPREQPALQEFIEENSRTGRIRPSKSPNASPFFFGMKPDGSGLRPIQDYRKLNEFTIKNRYPLPLIREIIDKLKGAKYFTKLDVRWGFNNVRIHEGDEWKAAFRTNLGLFEPTVMFFGLTNSPATFQTMMNHILRDLIGEGKVAVYLDDILIFTKDLAEHREIIRRVLQILRENKLSLKPQKCEFEREEMKYLGMIIGRGEVRMDPAKVTAVGKWPTPKNKKEVQQFLGFANYYRRFIRGFSGVARPLTALTGNSLWHWGSEQTEAFEELKRRICSEPVLMIPVDNAPYRLEVDSSDYASGAVLSQRVDDKWHPIAYMSKALNETQWNYEIYDKEMLAIMTALDEWRQYLLGASEKFEIWTDHQNLQYFRKPQKLNRRQARWVSELAEYHYDLKHKAGKSNVKPDILSRRPDLERGENDNENVILLKPEHFRRQEFIFQSLDDDFLTRIRASSGAKDRIVERALAGNEKSWQEHEDGVVTWQERIYVPRNKRLREDIIREHHDSVAAGHPGRYKTQELITRNYWWPYIQSDIRKYVDGCEACQRSKTRRQKPRAPLNPNEVPSGPWEHISVDLIGKLPESQGFNAILVIVDRFSKMIIVIPTNMELTAVGMARIY